MWKGHMSSASRPESPQNTQALRLYSTALNGPVFSIQC
uniref:Uncharacterized protein n=2 Tax=Anguilla anguilla TaxID=7936 RepID=A0A0E9QYZ2_ANGAN